MTRDEILNLPKGTKINQLVWWRIFDMTPPPPNNDMLLLPDYSGDMTTAMTVVKKLAAGVFHLELTSRRVIVDFSGYQNARVVIPGLEEDAPLAICQAALLAKLTIEEKAGA